MIITLQFGIIFSAAIYQMQCQTADLGSWSQFGQCSRTCGGGVQSRQRSCLQNSATAACTEKTKDYRLCNTQECPGNTGDFRAAQCSEHDSKPLDGTLYKWLPYHQGGRSLECQLICAADGESFFHKLANKVIDGTPCNQDTRNVCVDGKCRMVGCDMVLDSTVVEDNCGVCNGRNDNCHTVKGTLGHKEGKKVVRIPVGARTVKITSSKPGKSYLAVQVGTESHTLVGNIGQDGEIPLYLSGLKLMYHISSEDGGKQKLTAMGPTNDTVIVTVMKPRMEHVVYHYQYSLVEKNKMFTRNVIRSEDTSHSSQRAASSSNLDRSSVSSGRYVWLTGHWTPCSKDCGEGYQRRLVSCMDTISHRVVQSGYCSRLKPPHKQRKCMGKNCGNTATVNVQWERGAWGPCSTSCGLGEQSTSVYCKAIRADDSSFVTSDTQCLEEYKIKPTYMRSCNDDVICPEWETTKWSECSSGCGLGEKTRRVYCRGPDATGNGRILSPSACSSLDKPLDRKSCFENIRCDEGGTSAHEREEVRCNSIYGCCPDGVTPARGYNREGCSGCNSPYGCCPDGVTPARGYRYQGCPRRDSHATDVCSKDKEKGPCSNYTIRWYFDSKQKACLRFWFGGCDPGENNFMTQEECKKTCSGATGSTEHSSGSDHRTGHGSSSGSHSGSVSARCRQNKDRGPCTKYKVNWYYNYNDKRCQRFWYGGCQGNTNRFETEEECKAACSSDVGTTGETDRGTNTATDDRTGTGSTDNTGDRIVDTSDVCRLPSKLGSCRDYKVKWFHNATTRSCGRFWYGGCDGNGNNFDTKEDCEAKCLITVAVPTTTTTSAPLPTTKPGECPRLSVSNIGPCVQNCKEDLECEGNQKCCSNGCGMTCQDPSDSYLLTPPVNLRADMVSSNTAFVTWTDVDAADATERRFYSVRYKPLSADQDNSYTMLNTTAQQVYVTGLKPSQQYEFAVKVIQGTKFSLWSMAAYNKTRAAASYKPGECPAVTGSAGICVEGCSSDNDCGGSMKCCSNGCGHTCRNPVIVEVAPPEKPTGSGTVAQYCSLDAERGPCSNYSVKWHFSPKDGRCTRFWYGGCQGNKNNFASEDECDAACRKSVTVQDVCQLPQVHGPCKAAHRRWYYETSSRDCREFLYGGCRGNENRFMTRAECLIRCGSDETKLKVNGFYAMDKSNNKITLKWDPPVMAKDVRQYRLSYSGERYYRDGIQRDDTSVLDIPGSASSYSINGLKPATQYKFNLTAILGDGRRGPTEYLITNTMSETPEYKQGECPRVEMTEYVNPDCKQLCSTDYDCADNLKCCRDSCGKSCQRPRPRETIRMCYDAQYGCCLDDVTIAQGPNYEGCPDACQTSEFGCCRDGTTPASGPNGDGCEYGSGTDDNFCEQSVYQCCADGITPAQGPNKEGCPEYTTTTQKPVDLGPVCQQPAQRGPCSDYTVKYFYNATSSKCQRFWYGGCQGNQNNFDNSEDCEATCTQKETLPVCQQPKRTGRCRGYFKKFYYNSQSGKCEQFIYGGCDGNDNNFEAEDDCRRKCETGDRITNNRCQLPADVGPCGGSIPRWFFDTRRGECVEFGWGGCEGNLNNFIDKETCLQQCSEKVVIGRNGDVCRMPSETGRCRAAVPRWFYDYNDGICKKFTYGGCEGNQNNFQTKEECQSRCSREYVCRPYEEPTVACLAYFPRYRYIAAKDDCEQFIYGGCLGSSNNFETLAACRGKCQGPVDPPVYDNICALIPEAGRCRGREIKWFFNSTASRCERFIYGGCDGNPNRFDTLEECDGFCNVDGSGVVTVDVDIGVDSSYCHLPKDVGHCNNNTFPAWYYDHQEGVCKEFVFGGCGGNKNRFTSREVCESSCSRDVVCRLQQETGPCKAKIPRYYYDLRTGRCTKFGYGGCDGNANNFATREACGNKCGDAYTPDGTTSISPSIPKEQCQQPKDFGNGQGREVMYYYNPAVGDCQPFWYSGAGGNNNRFRNSTRCRTVCRRDNTRVPVVTPRPPVTTTPPTIPSPDPGTDVIITGNECDENSERGPCTNYTVKWFYNRSQGRCTRFWYGGCEGNGNKFDSEAACKARCVEKGPSPTVYPTRAPPQRPCDNTQWGCCPDGVTPALDFYFSNCRVYTGSETADLVDGNATVIIEQPDRSLLIECRGPQGTVAWYKNARILTSDQRFTVFENGSLFIAQLNKDDSGVYACRIDNGQNQPAVRRFRLQIEVPITIFPTPSTIVVRPGENAFLHCQAYGSPQPTVTWTKDGQSIASGGRYYMYQNGTLIISNTQQTDISDYTCTARNGRSSPAQRLVRLSLQESVSASIKPIDGRLREGENLYLACDSRGFPPPTVRWEKMGVELITTGRMTVNGPNLRITDLTLDDTGSYTCVVNNAEDSAKDSKSIQVIPKDVDIPECVDSASVTMCRLIVRAGLCGYTDYSKQCCYSCDQSKLRG